MGKLIDLTGSTFGRLFVIKRAPRPSGGRSDAYWECLCTCGTTCIVPAGNLRSGNSTSCGCLHKEQLADQNRQKLTMDPWEVDMRLYIRRLDYRVKRSGLGSNQFRILNSATRHPATSASWELTLEYYKKLVTGVCHYCGNPPNQLLHGAASDGLLRNGIDRVNNKKGYEMGNCVSCCILCNRDKRAQPIEVFVENTRRRYNWMLSNGLITR